ncbi:MAG: HEAT repeat domain-containing protein [Methanobacteriota archaeon]|nr:MAG: HEAT repeat domain-containing protein [Euryarchaeota archaeon]
MTGIDIQRSAWWRFQRSLPDIEEMRRGKNISGLMKALRDRNFEVQLAAAEALGKMGNEALGELKKALASGDRDVQLGAIGALGEIKNPDAVPALIERLVDPSIEVRWAAAIALGEIGDTRATPGLIGNLADPDKYVRYGAAIALEKLGWVPVEPIEASHLAIARQDWETLVRIGAPSVQPLVQLMRDRQSEVRVKALECLGKIGDPSASAGMLRALRDENADVRWQAVLSCPKCGISAAYLPRGLAKRPRVRKNPTIAGLLNFLLPGQGYNYLGYWWGVLLFQADVTVTLYLLSINESLTYGTLFPLYLLIALHAWYVARNLPDL